MKTVFLHGLGQTARDWLPVLEGCSLEETDRPELFTLSKGPISYGGILDGLEERYADESEPLRLCGLSLGAVLALDYASRNIEKVSSLVLIAPQYKVPTRLIDLQNALFRLMPRTSFAEMGMEKEDVIRLSHSMRALDFRDVLKNITCPVTILCGQKDGTNLKAARQLQTLLLHAQLLTVPNAGHELNKCAPDAIVQALSMDD